MAEKRQITKSGYLCVKVTGGEIDQLEEELSPSVISVGEGVCYIDMNLVAELGSSETLDSLIEELGENMDDNLSVLQLWC